MSDKKLNMKDFFTRDRANEGIELPLFAPGSNEKSGHWLRVRGVDSDEFRSAQVLSHRNLRDAFEDGKVPTEKFHIDQKRLLVSSLVAGWSFDTPFTRENLIEFLTNAPQIEEAVNQIATRRNLFFKNGSTASTDTPEPSSN